MAKRKFRVGIVGCGGIVDWAHAPAWMSKPDEIEIVALCDVDKGRVEQLAKKTGARHLFTDFRKLVRLKELDAVDICTPNRLHTPAVLAALQSGKHVICEKPLAVTTREVRQMGKLADGKKLKLMTAQHMRYMPMSTVIKKFIEDGAVGAPLHARVYAMRRNWLPTGRGFIDKKLSGGGACMDIGVHALDTCLWLLGFPSAVRVSGVSRVNFAKGNTIPGGFGEWNRKLFTVEDSAVGFAHFDNGMTMILEAAWLNHQEEDEVMRGQLFGLRGSVEWPTGKYCTVKNRVAYSASLRDPRSNASPYAAELMAFVDCVINHKPSPVPWQETIKVIAILEAIYQSQKARREIRVRSW